jgi:hypothetical protein
MEICVALEEGVRFQRGHVLTSAQDLIGKLNQLSKVKDERKFDLAYQLERQIRDMARPGIYAGYLDDGLEKSIVRLLHVKRRGDGANAHTFYVELEMLDDTVSVGGRIWEMDLMQFLSDINRVDKTDRQRIEPRFTPF